MKNLLAKIYSYKFFNDLIFIYPFYMIMFADRGLSALQISVILAFWSGSAFLFEVPSGVLADRFSRKQVLIVGQLIRVAGYLLWLLFPSFVGFLIGFVCWGIGSAFASGTFEALVYDELKVQGTESHYTKIIGRANSLGHIAVFLASVIASILISGGYDLVLLTSLISLILSALAVALLPESRIFESTGEKEYFKFLKDGFRQAVKTPSIFHLIIYLSLILALTGALDEYWPIFASNVGLTPSLIAIFIAVYSLINATASWAAHWFKDWSIKSSFLTTSLGGLLLLMASLIMKPVAVILLLAFSFVFMVIGTVTEGRLQDLISSDKRATISSVKGFFVEIFVTIFYLGFGTLAKLLNYQQAFLSVGIIIFVLGAFYLFTVGEEKATA